MAQMPIVAAQCDLPGPPDASAVQPLADTIMNDLGLEALVDIEEDDGAISIVSNRADNMRCVSLVMTLPCGDDHAIPLRGLLTNAFKFHMLSQGSRKKPRNSTYGEARWTEVASANLSSDQVGQLASYETLADKSFNIISFVALVGLGAQLDALAEDGGGWSLACPREGIMSKVTNDIAWKLRCKSHNSYGCPAKVEIIYRVATDYLVIKHAVGWAHKHTGDVLTETGCPPALKALIDRILAANPTMKFRALCNTLYEQHGVEKALESRISDCFIDMNDAMRCPSSL